MGNNNPTLTLSSMVQGFIFTLSSEGKAQTTIDYYQGNLNRFLWYAKEHKWPDDPRDLDTWKMREFLAYAGTATNRWGATGNGSENCRQPSRTCGWRYFRTLRFFFNWTTQEGLIEKNPLKNIKPQAPKQKPIEPYTQQDMKKLLDLCETDFNHGGKYLGARNKAIIMLFVDSGMRLSELANLRMTDISLDKGRAVVLGKGNQQRVVAFSPVTRKVLWKYIAFREKVVKDMNQEWLWITEEGERLAVAGINITFRRIKKRAGINSSGAVHRLRHTFAVNALRGIKDPTLLQLLLGHKTLEMTRRYTQGLKIEEALVAIEKASPVDTLGIT
jgi:site-specific recombinase XerD